MRRASPDTGSAGKITNCQIGVFAGYASRHGHAFIDRALYLPKTWTSDPARLAAAHVPQGAGFSTKLGLALAMIDRAIAAGVPFSWVAADTVYGVGDIGQALRRAGKGYVLGVKSDHKFNAWVGKPLVAGTAEAIADGLAPSAWIRLSAGECTKGARLYDWAYCALADLDGAAYDQTGLWTHGLLIRRSLADGARAYFTTWCPAGTPPAEAARSLIRWSVQEIRRIAVRLAQRRIQPAHVIARSLWRRAHQAAARNAHLKRRASDAKGRRRRKPSKTRRRRENQTTQL